MVSVRRVHSIVCSWLACAAVSGALAADYDPVAVPPARYGPDHLGMMKAEAERLATEIASFTARRLAPRIVEKNDARAVEIARRALAVALALDPRGREALVTNFQLARGVAPSDPPEPDFSPEVLAQFLTARATPLKQSESAAAVEMAGFFLSLAVEIDPANEEAVYQWELYKLDHPPIDWSAIVNSVAESEESDGD